MYIVVKVSRIDRRTGTVQTGSVRFVDLAASDRVAIRCVLVLYGSITVK